MVRQQQPLWKRAEGARSLEWRQWLARRRWRLVQQRERRAPGFFADLPQEEHTTEDALSALEIVAVERNGTTRQNTSRGPAQVNRYSRDRYFFMTRTLRHASDGLRRGDLYIYLDQRDPARSFVRYLERSRTSGTTTAYDGTGNFRLQPGAAEHLRLALAATLNRADGVRSTRLELRGLIVGRHGVPRDPGGFGRTPWGRFPTVFDPLGALIHPALDAFFDEAEDTEEGLWIQSPPLGFEDDLYDWDEGPFDTGMDEQGGLVVDPSVAPPPPPILGEPVGDDPGVGGSTSGTGPSGSDTGDGALLGDDEDEDGVPLGTDPYDDWSFSSPAPSTDVGSNGSGTSSTGNTGSTGNSGSAGNSSSTGSSSASGNSSDSGSNSSSSDSSSGWSSDSGSSSSDSSRSGGSDSGSSGSSGDDDD